MVAFNYRFVPAIMQARKLIESGKLGKIYHWRAVYLQEWGMDPTDADQLALSEKRRRERLAG